MTPKDQREGLEQEAQRLREKTGASYQEIADALGVSKSHAHELCNPDSVVAYNRRRRRYHQSTPERREANRARCRLYRSTKEESK